jgi:hypothetical protein
LVGGAIPNGRDVSAHVESCPACAELLADGGELASRLAAAQRAESREALDPSFASLQSAIQAERGPAAWLRSRPTEQRVALGLVAAASIAIGELLRSPRADLAVYPMATLLFEMSLYGLVLGVSTHFALRPLQRRAAPGWVGALVATLALAVPVVLAAAAPVHLAHSASLAGSGDALVPRALGCFAFGAALGVAMLLLLRALDRGAHGAPAAVVVAAPLAGLVGNLALHLHCPITHRAHLFLGHVTVGFALLLVYAAVAHVLARRPRQA